MNAATVSEDVKAYLSAVRARLDDLPADERDDLLADVEPSILESAEESDAPVELRLGPAESFADELRAAAGLPPRAEPGGPAGRPGPWARFAAWSAPRWLRELAPLWWVLRALVAVGLFDLFYGRSALADDDYAVVLVGAAAVAVVVSVALGLRRSRRRAVVTSVNLALALAAPVVLATALADARAGLFDGEVMLVMSSQPTTSRFAYDGNPVQNVYAFDRRGRLLLDVRLYAEDGQSLDIGSQDPRRRRVRTREGELALNAFPIRYFEPGTRRVADPTAGAPPRPAPLATEPLTP